MSETEETQGRAEAAPASAWSDLVGCPMLGFCLSLATSWFLSHRPLAWLVGLLAGLASVVGVYAVAAGYGTVDRAGVRWLGCRLRWDEVVGVRLHAGQWLIETTRGDRAMPAWLVNKGAVASEVMRRAEPASAETSAVDDATLRAWLGLGATGSLVVYGGRPMARQRTMRLFVAGALCLLLLGVVLACTGADMPGITMMGVMLLAVGLVGLRGPNATVTVNETGFDVSPITGRVPWSSLVAVAQVKGGYVLHTTRLDLLIPGNGSAQAMLLRAAERYLAARGPRPASLDEPTDAALSPAERLTGETERALSRVERH